MTKKKENNIDLSKLYEDYINRGGKVDIFEPGQRDERPTVGSVAKKVPELLTLEEGANLYTKKQTRPRKVKNPDFSKINKDLIPEHLRHILESNNSIQVEEFENIDDDEEEVEE